MRESGLEEKSEDTAEKILFAHTEISKFGYRRTSINDVAEESRNWQRHRSTSMEEEARPLVAGWSDLTRNLDSC